MVGGRKHGEEIAVPFAEQRDGGTVRLDHRHTIFLGDGRDRLGETGRIGPEQIFHIVLLDQPLDKLRAARRRRFIIVIDDLEPVGPARDLHPARFIDAFDRKVVAIARERTIRGIFSCEGDRRSEPDRGRRIGQSCPAGQESRREHQAPCKAFHHVFLPRKSFPPSSRDLIRILNGRGEIPKYPSPGAGRRARNGTAATGRMAVADASRI